MIGGVIEGLIGGVMSIALWVRAVA